MPYWIVIVPQNPEHMPSSDNAQVAAKILEQMASGAEKIEIIKDERVQFFDCGGNLETVSCPRCHADIDTDWWSQTMSADFDEDTGFMLNDYRLPCCSSSVSLNALDYSFHQAFGRFALSAMNPKIGELSVEAIVKIEAALGCEVSVVYQHI